MNDDDDLSKTMLIPNPGGRRGGAHQPLDGTQINQPVQPTPPAHEQPPQPPGHQYVSPQVKEENILLGSASELLTIAGNVRSLSPTRTVEQLRRDIESLFSKFETKLKQQSVSEEVILTARYMLCCLVDELVLSTPWGIESSWSHQTLLSKYHNETSGGEKFFLIVNKILEQPQRNIDLIELAYVCIAFGFRGKYGVIASGQNEIESVSLRLFHPITLYRPQPNDLSPNWQGAKAPPASFEKRFPPILFFTVLVFIATIFYVSFLSNLHASSSQLYAKIESIGWQDFNVNMAENLAPVQRDLDAIASDIREKLSAAIQKNQLIVDVEQGKIILRLISPQLFPPGRTSIMTEQVPEVNEVLNALRPYTNSLMIVGHTDSTGRAESNWVISRKRAESVEQWLKSGMPPIPQTITRGVADTQPFVPEDEDQSQNRRVEIIALVKG